MAACPATISIPSCATTMYCSLSSYPYYYILLRLRLQIYAIYFKNQTFLRFFVTFQRKNMSKRYERYVLRLAAEAQTGLRCCVKELVETSHRGVSLSTVRWQGYRKRSHATTSYSDTSFLSALLRRRRHGVTSLQSLHAAAEVARPLSGEAGGTHRCKHCCAKIGDK